MQQDITKSATLTDEQKEEMLRLWNNEYPASLSYASVAALNDYLSKLEDQCHYMITGTDSALLAWAFSFTRDAERWFAIIVDGRLHGQGYGRLLLSTLQQEEPVLNGWVSDTNNYLKANGLPYISPLGFYTKQGFHLTSTRLKTDTLSAVRIEWRR